MKIYKTFRGLAVVSLSIVLSLCVYHIVTSDDGVETLKEHKGRPPDGIYSHKYEQKGIDASVEHTHATLTHSHPNWSALRG